MSPARRRHDVVLDPGANRPLATCPRADPAATLVPSAGPRQPRQPYRAAGPDTSAQMPAPQRPGHFRCTTTTYGRPKVIERISEASPRRLARIAGLLYVVSAAGALFPELVRSNVIVPGDAAATAHNIRASATLFRLGFVTEVASNITWLPMLMLLYLLFRHVNQLVAATMVLFAAVGAAVQSLNMLHHYTALTIATDDAYTRTFGQAGADALTQLFTDMHYHGYRLNLVFVGPWLVPLGYLVIKSGYLPKVLGVLLITGCFGYLAVFVTTFLAPDAPENIRTLFTAVGGVGEMVFMFWLLVKAVRVPVAAAPVPAVLNQPQR
jgi:hypothetical protein